MDFLQFLIILIIPYIFFKLIKSDKNDIIKTSPELFIKGYDLIYTDQKGDFDKQKIVVSEIIVSEKFNLRGKPDYIFRSKNKKDLIPVEIKSGIIKNAQTPHLGDMMQLAAYFLLIEDYFNVKPLEGRIIYKDYMFIIRNTNNIKNELLKTINDMEKMLETGDFYANPSFSKCRYCICNGTVCEHSKTKQNNNT